MDIKTGRLSWTTYQHQPFKTALSLAEEELGELRQKKSKPHRDWTAGCWQGHTESMDSSAASRSKVCPCLTASKQMGTSVLCQRTEFSSNDFASRFFPKVTKTWTWTCQHHDFSLVRPGARNSPNHTLPRLPAHGNEDEMNGSYSEPASFWSFAMATMEMNAICISNLFPYLLLSFSVNVKSPN